MLKKITAAVAAAVLAVSMAGCSGGYKMTNEDLELQKSMIGYWVADNSTGLNEFDENGSLTLMTAVQFTDDFHYVLYECQPNTEQMMVMTYEPVSYTIEEGKFKVERGGLASYAGVSISADGSTMSWITDESTDLYLRISDEEAYALNIPAYDPDIWAETESTKEEEQNNG